MCVSPSSCASSSRATDTPSRNGTTIPSCLAAASPTPGFACRFATITLGSEFCTQRQRSGCFAPQATKLSKISGKGRPVARAYLARSWRPSASFTSANRSFSSVIPANALSSLAAWGWDVISINGSWAH